MLRQRRSRATLAAAAAEHPFQSISLGSMPPEDFATEFRYPLDLIKVSAEPLIARDEVRRAVRVAGAGSLRQAGVGAGRRPRERARE